MGRIIGGIVLGYVVMFLVVFALLTGGYFALGADRAFRPGTYDVSGAWIVVWLVVGIVAAVLGGMVCGMIGRSPKATMGLAVLVLLLGLLSAIPSLKPPAGEPEPRTAAVGNLEAMTRAKSPAWMALLNPIIGCAGVLAGAKRRKTPGVS